MIVYDWALAERLNEPGREGRGRQPMPPGAFDGPLVNTNFVQGRGFAIYSPNPATTVRPNYHEGPLGAGAAIVSLFQANKDFVDASSGHFLVRAADGSTEVPEPTTLGLLGAGLLALGLAGRKRIA